MGSSNLGWLNSKFHFSFSSYYNPKNMNFGVLRVINDDIIKPKYGFNTHPHKDMEIITYVINGELTHEDNINNKNAISRGHIQYMSAGTGVFHSEFNYSNDNLRLLQIWIYPDKKGHQPSYGDYKFDWSSRKNKWLHMVSNKENDAPIKINQDVNIYVVELDKSNEISFNVDHNRQAYLIQIEGSSSINDINLKQQDGLEIIENNIVIKAISTSHIMIIEMNKE